MALFVILRANSAGDTGPARCHVTGPLSASFSGRQMSDPSHTKNHGVSIVSFTEKARTTACFGRSAARYLGTPECSPETPLGGYADNTVGPRDHLRSSLARQDRPSERLTRPARPRTFRNAWCSQWCNHGRLSSRSFPSSLSTTPWPHEHEPRQRRQSSTASAASLAQRYRKGGRR